MVLVCILLAIVALVLLLLLNTAVKTAKARKLQGVHPEFTQEQLAEYGKSLQEMIRCKTVSVKDSYDDTEFAKLRAVVEQRFPLLHQKTQRQIFAKDCWMYKIPGKDASRNILLMSHHDVVPADEEWKYEPFSGHIEDGVIYGRGAADTKGSLCAILSGMEEMLAEDFVPEVNVYIVSSHNEELGGDGITSAREYFQQQGIRFEVILDEGGAIVDPPLGNMNCEKCAMVAVHEKGRCKVTCTATWASNHVSLTGYKNNPVERMAAFIKEISSGKVFITRLSPPVTEMFARLAPYCGFPMNVLFCNLWLFSGIIRKVLPSINATAGGMVGTTCAFQTIEGGTNDKYCKATHQEYYKPADLESKAYAYTMDCLKEVFPKYPAAPYILPAGTDAWKLTPVCDCVLRFAPTRMDAKQLGSIHAVNENIDVSAIAEAAAFYKYFAKNYK